MTIDLVTRREWGARESHGAYGSLTSTKGVKVHYTGGHEKPEMLDDHKLCTLRVRAIQNQHMDGNGWIDVGYSLLVCPHRKVFEGRGLKHLPAANGEGLNSGHYAVLGMVGDSGLTEPNDDMLHGIVDAIEYLRAKGGAGKEVKGHRDGYATTCPGGPLYAWVKAGAPRPKDAPLAVGPDGVPVFQRMLVNYAGDRMMHGPDVLAWQKRIEKRGWKIDTDGWYGSDSAGVCEAFQRAIGGTPSGRVDKTTWSNTWLWTKPQPGLVDESN